MRFLTRFLLGSTLSTAMVAGASAAAPAETAPATQPYPLEVCVVSGEKLGSMGKPYVITHEGREVRLCCQGCEADFKKDPAKYLKKLDEAAPEKDKTAK